MTQLESAKLSEVTLEMEAVSKGEAIPVKRLMKGIAEGRIVIPANKLHKKLNPIGIGDELRTKVNANIGSSPNKADIQDELKKLDVAVGAGTDTIMDLSTGGDIDKIRQEIVAHSTIPVGTVPIYQAVVEKGDVLELKAEDFLKAIRKHARDGVDFLTIHSGLTREVLPLVKKRLAGVVSRGGAFLVKWMLHHRAENPLFENFDKILDIAIDNDVTLSLGDGLRPGCIKDATDKAQIHELKVLGQLAKRAMEKNVQVIIEGPGHVPLNQIEMNLKLQKEYCNNAPFYVLGPLVTDIAPGYDHITSAIGGALAAYHGASFLCYVSPKEHLGLPNPDDVREGVIASRIAAHAADIAKGIKGAQWWDDELSEARSKLDWDTVLKLSINPEKARKIREESGPVDDDVCSMCGKFCSVKISKEMKKK
ncbi:phosphomethylpyrimidine synthase ThiC [Candidatus Woesearchaeota archaeon]|nr:phosphomethylpyrimidine synthase ThiC [Candidatus Woesearchaeota archaeon]